MKDENSILYLLCSFSTTDPPRTNLGPSLSPDLKMGANLYSFTGRSSKKKLINPCDSADILKIYKYV